MPKQSDAVNASIVAPIDNKLVYAEYTEKGDKIGDFSYAGFYAGDYELPVSENLPIAMELSPSGTSDDTEMLQNAINKVYEEAEDDSMKIIKLKAGRYNINQTGISLKSGIVLMVRVRAQPELFSMPKIPFNTFPSTLKDKSPQSSVTR